MFNLNNLSKSIHSQTQESVKKPLCKKMSDEEVKKKITERKNKFFLGHYNSIKTDQNIYDGSDRFKLCAEMAKMLETLPEPFSQNINLDEKEQLLEAFKLAASEKNKKKIHQLIQEGNLVILPLGYPGHTMHIVFCKGYMAILNRGEGVPQSYSKWPEFIRKIFSSPESIQAFKIDLKLFTEEILTQLLKWDSKKKEEALKYYYETLPSLLSPRDDKKPVQDCICKQLKKLCPKLQKIGNCSATQAKLSMRVCKAMLNIRKNELGILQLTSKDLESAYEFSKDLSSHIRLFSMDRYLMNHPNDSNAMDESLLLQTYAKLKKRLSTFPEAHFYPYLEKWKKRLESEWFKNMITNVIPSLL